MTDMFRSMMRFSWAMSLFGARQAAELLSALGTVRSPRQATASFDAISRAAEEQLGDSRFAEAYRTADRWQADLIDAVFGAADPALEVSRGLASKTLLRGSLVVLRQSASLLENALPTSNRVIWRELRNKLEAFETFQYVDQILGYESLESGDLLNQIEKAEGSGPYLKLWLTEGLGFAFAEVAWDRGEPAELLRRVTLDAIPAESLIPLHTGMGLSLARRTLPELEAAEPDLGPALKHFARLCESNARDGFALACYEALGLIVRQLAPRMTSVIDRELAHNPEDSHRRDAFWHGVGRGLYFTATQAVPGSTGRAVAKARDETTSDPARHNALAGLAWALTLVNFRQPEVLEEFLLASDFDGPESAAVGDGIASAVLLWRDAAGGERHYQNFRAYCGDSVGGRWRRMVVEPCDAALGGWEELKKSPGPGAIFRVRAGE